MSSSKPSDILDKLSDSLKSELNRSLRRVMATADDPDSLWIRIPDDKDIDLSLGELGKLVATSSNNFTDATRFNGIIQAELSKAEGRYKSKFEKAMGEPAKNEAERKAHAHKVAEEEWEALQLVRYLAELSKSAENAGRVASESARKLLDKVNAIHIGETRAEHGQKFQPTAIDTGF